MHLAVARGIRGQPQRAGREVQRLAHVERDVAIEAQQAIDVQRSGIEAAGLDRIHAVAGLAIDQGWIELAGNGLRAQAAAAVVLFDHQLARDAHAIGDLGALAAEALDRPVDRRFKIQRQRPTARAAATGGGMQGAVDEQPIAGTQRDDAAVAGNGGRAEIGQVQHRLRTGGVQAGALAHHHECIDRREVARCEVMPCADLDRAARQHLAVPTAGFIQGRIGHTGHVQHGLLTDPDRARVGRALGQVEQAAFTQVTAEDRDASTAGLQGTVEGDLCVAGQGDGLAGIDVDPAVAADLQVGRVLRRAGGQ
ncbi:hypothetical protein D3C71_1135600 [compost metagenome]